METLAIIQTICLVWITAATVITAVNSFFK